MKAKPNEIELYNIAHIAGKEAVERITYIAPMVVIGGNDKIVDVVADGPCGFAWVNVKPGNCKFANVMKTQGLAHKSYYGGVDIWVSDYNQSMAKKSTYAIAFAKVLRDHGINAYSQSRMD